MAKPLYDPAHENLTYPAGATGDLEYTLSDVVDATKAFRMQVRDVNNAIVFTKDTADGSITVTGTDMVILMTVADTKGKAATTHKYEIEMYDLTTVEVNPLINGRFIIEPEIANFSTP